MKVIELIYATLGDKQKRKEYDVFLSKANQFSVKLEKDEDSDYGNEDEVELTEDERREQEKSDQARWKK